MTSGTLYTMMWVESGLSSTRCSKELLQGYLKLRLIDSIVGDNIENRLERCLEVCRCLDVLEGCL